MKKKDITKLSKQKKIDKMIMEGEEDIKAGRLHSQSDVQKMIKDWTKE